MRVFALAVLGVFAAAPLSVYADGDKQLQSVRGSVSYQHGKGTRPLARSATIVLVDKDFAITGDASLAAVVLPDSSRVTMGSLTRVQMAYFTQLEGTTAKFVLYGGKTRFKIEHPNGKPANYTFQTPTAQIAVRGTEGDIGVDGHDHLVVNVYGLTDPNLPVVVTTEDGKQYVLKAGQQLLANWVNGQIQTTVGTLTEQAVAQFEEIGAPASDWASAVQNLPQNVVDNAVSQVPIVGGLLPHISFGRHRAVAQATPSPSPSPCVTAPPGKTKATPAPCISPSPTPMPAPPR